MAEATGDTSGPTDRPPHLQVPASAADIRREQRDAEWLELFFDLVVVAAVAVITETITEHPGWTALGLAALAYAAIWQSWLAVVLYANVAERVLRTQTVVTAMFAIALMAASVPGHFDARANLFAVGFLVVRAVAAQAALRTGRVLASYPLLQAGGLSLPWIIAMWVPIPGKYWLWAFGLILDFVFLVLRSDRGAETVAQLDAKMARAKERRRPSDRHASQGPDSFEAVDVDTDHLDERLSLFVIIVLGEVVVQIVVTASRVEWVRHFPITVAASFALIVSLWWLTFSSGSSGAHHTRLAELAPRLALPLHLATTFGIVMLASGLSAAVAHPDAGVDDAQARIMAAGLALHFAATAVAALAARRAAHEVALVYLPCVLAPLVLIAFAARIDDNLHLVGGLLAITWWAVVCGLIDRRRDQTEASISLSPA